MKRKLYMLALLLLCNVCLGETYVVKKNDSLWMIAKREYGLKSDAAIDRAWRYIAAENRITKPKRIRPGLKLTIPRTLKRKVRRTPPPGYRYWKTVNAKVTAYEPSAVSCGKFANGKTSIGRNAWRVSVGVAISPKAIPYGTMLYIPKIGWRKADDTGSAMEHSWGKGVYHIDVRMTYVYECMLWGKKWLKVDLYEQVKKSIVIASL